MHSVWLLLLQHYCDSVVYATYTLHDTSAYYMDSKLHITKITYYSYAECWCSACQRQQNQYLQVYCCMSDYYGHPMEQGRLLYFSPVVSSFYFLFFLAYSQPSQIGCLPYFHTWCGLSANIGCRSETCCKWLAENTGRKKIQKNSPSAHYLTTLSGYILATKAHIDNRQKSLLNSNIFSTCPHNMVNFSPLVADTSSLVLGHPRKFQRVSLHVLAQLLQQHRSTEGNQTLHDVWPSPGLIQYIYIFGGYCPVMEFFHVQNSLCVQVFHSIRSVTARHSSSGRLPNFAALSRGRNLYSAGQPLGWALAHILVCLRFTFSGAERSDWLGRTSPKLTQFCTTKN